MKIYSVRDDKAAAYLPPFYMRTEAEALRAFTEAANSAEHNFCKHAGDFHLFELGDWDEQAGKLTPNDAPRHIVCAMDMRHNADAGPLFAVQGGE